MTRIALVGEVRTAEFTLRGMLRAGRPPCVIATTDVRAVQRRSRMAPEYYADLAGRGAELGIPTLVLEEPRTLPDVFAEHRPDFAFVTGWPYLVRSEALELVPCIGMHPSRLPERRGGAPLNWAILDGERSSAVSLIRLRDGLDDGEILAQHDFAIGDDEYVGEVLERVLAITEELVAESVARLVVGTEAWQQQDAALATYTRRRTPEDGRIDWSESAIRIRNLVRASSRPFPGAFTMLGGRTLRVWRAEVPRGYRAPLRAVPGTVVAIHDRGVLISTRDNALLLTEAQVEGEASFAGSELAGRFADRVGTELSLEAVTT